MLNIGLQIYRKVFRKLSVHNIIFGLIILAVSASTFATSLVAIYSKRDHLILHLFVAFILQIILTSIIVRALREFVSGPIKKFSSVAKQLPEAGEVDFSFLSTLKGYELIDLADSFKRMTERLREKDVSTKRTQNVLENLVADRTISVLKTSTELLIARDMAEAASKSKTIFLSHMSSMLRTPLNGIILYTELISEHMDEPVFSPAMVKKDLGKIRSSADQLLQTIDKILELSQVELGQIHLSQDNIITMDLLHEAESLGRSLVKKNDNFFEMNIPKNLPPKFRADHAKVKQILFSILDNSNKFTTRGIIKLSVEVDDEYITFIIQDTGCGMAPEVHETMFKGLLTGDALNGQDSLGLSLALAKRYVDFMGGDIIAKSSENQGSIFIVKIPLTASYVDQDQLQASVLSIGLNSNLGDNVSSSLTKRGLWVTTTSDYSEGVQLAEQLHPKFILYSLDKSDIGSWRGLALLRSKPALDQSKIILLHPKSHGGGGKIGNLQEVLPKPASKERLSIVLHYNSVTRSRPYILIIEDDRPTALALSRQVEANGWVTEVCYTAESAQPYLTKNSPPSLILLDILLPGMSGLDFIRMIKDQKNPTPVVVVTSKVMDGEDLARLNTGLVEKSTDEGLIAEISQRIQKS